MKDIFKKNITFAIALLLTLTMSSMLATIQPASALSKSSIYVYANPNPAGINQQMTVVGWITPLPSYAPPNWIYWTGVTLSITGPDGRVENIPVSTDVVAAFWFNYLPTALGTYTIKASWDGNSSAPAQAFRYAPSSTTYQFTVQQAQILPWPDAQLPTGYWQRPINQENRNWNVLAGSWPWEQGNARGGYDAGASTDYQPYSQAPNSSHINWVLQASQGGLVGGLGAKADDGSGNFMTSAKLQEPVDMLVLCGLGYYVDGWNPVPSSGGASTLLGTPQDLPKATDLTTFTIHCVDIRTGKELWAKQTYSYGLTPTGGTGRTGSMIQGQIEPIPAAASSGSSGPKAFLVSIGTTFVRWDAFTGNMLVLMNNSMTGTFDGQYVYSRSGSRLIKWDTMAIGKGLNNTIASAVVYNVTAPSVTHGTTTSYLSPSQISGNIGVGTYSVAYADGSAPGLAGIDLKTGKLLWNTTNYGYEGGEGTGSMGYGKYFYMAGDGAWHAFDVNTGREVWKSEPGVMPWAKFWGYSVAVAYNKLYAECYDGYIYAYDVDTGKTVWKFYSGNAGFETPYGEWPWFSNPVAADGKIYASTSEHSPTNPNWRGGKLYCFDANTGQPIWSIPWLGGAKGVADGVLIGQNEYDGQIYCFGKGLTATTVTAPDLELALNAHVLIKGTITDQSDSKTCLGISAAGTPAISDESMNNWMSYLYMQRPKPTNATGVYVDITATDPNGNYQHIGNVTSTDMGTFAIAWTPPVPGLYKVKATFGGSNSYYESSAETYFVVASAQPSASPTVAPTNSPSISPTAAPTTTLPSPTPAVEPPKSGISTTTLVAVSAAVVIIVVIAAATIILRKRK